MPYNFCSHCDSNYLDKLIALHGSMLRWIPSFHWYIVALDNFAWNFLAHQNPPLENTTIVNLSEIETPELLRIKGTRDWREYIWTLTPTVTYNMLCRHSFDEVAYLDIDTYFFTSPRLLYDEVRGANAEIAIVPHRFAPPDVHRAAVNGKYNVAWVYFRNTPTARKCLEQWRNQCNAWCSAQPADGKFGDQKYLDPWVECYGAYEVKNVGVDLAPWNQLQYQYEYDDGLYVIDAPRLDVGYGAIRRIDSLLFYHFHELIMDEHGAVRRTNWQLHADVARYVYPPYEQAIRMARQWIAERRNNAKKS